MSGTNNDSSEELPPLGVYVHWPYCARICPYCDFNVYKRRDIDAQQWSDALIRDLKRYAAVTPTRPLTSLYFGGGTPSLAPLSVLEAVINACAEIWGFRRNAEITVEANPTSAEKEDFKNFARTGVTRLSLGAQSLRDEALTFLDRDHNAREARAAIDLALGLFPKSSFDLIYALPEQTVDDWTRELRDAISIGPRHLSLYQLTIEPGTAFERAVARGAWTPPADGLAADMFDATQILTAELGLPAYEISNHARPEDMSQHNSLYWSGGDYIGVGPGAHGRLSTSDGRLATQTERAPEHYLAGRRGDEDLLSTKEILTESLAMGLRTVEGCRLTPSLHEHLAAKSETLSLLIGDGLLQIDDQALRATSAGRRVLNALVSELI